MSRGWAGAAKEGEMGDICNTVNKKIIITILKRGCICKPVVLGIPAGFGKETLIGDGAGERFHSNRLLLSTPVNACPDYGAHALWPHTADYSLNTFYECSQINCI